MRAQLFDEHVIMERSQMNDVMQRKSPAHRSSAQPLSHADKEFEAMKAYMAKVTKSKKAAQAFLKDAGIVDTEGALAKPYRT